MLHEKHVRVVIYVEFYSLHTKPGVVPDIKTILIRAINFVVKGFALVISLLFYEIIISGLIKISSEKPLKICSKLALKQTKNRFR